MPQSDCIGWDASNHSMFDICYMFTRRWTSLLGASTTGTSTCKRECLAMAWIGETPDEDSSLIRISLDDSVTDHKLE